MTFIFLGGRKIITQLLPGGAQSLHRLVRGVRQRSPTVNGRCRLARGGSRAEALGNRFSSDSQEAQLLMVQSAVMKQPNTQQLRSLRLYALARDDRAVAELNSRISNSPDYLIDELMIRHGWPAHEALCAVQQLQEEALRGTSDQQVS